MGKQSCYLIFGLLALSTLELASAAVVRGFAISKKWDWADNDCNIDEDDLPNFYAAISQARWDEGGACGRCIKIKSLSGRAMTRVYKLRIVDVCKRCRSGDLDLPDDTMELIAGGGDKAQIVWKWTACKVDTRSYYPSATTRAGRKLLA